ncbi:hypothetical protein [Weissella confusa]|uniref:hypothetical protein n=1 Tax=Weissella confusa TaxID=1583 RepID=UPI002F260950
MYIYNKKQVEQVVAVFSDVYDELAGRFIEKNEYSDESFAGYLYEHINDVLVFSNLEKFPIYRVKERSDISKTTDKQNEDILGVRVFVDNRGWMVMDSDERLSKNIVAHSDGVSNEERYYFRSMVEGVPAWEMQVISIDTDHIETYELQRSGVMSEVHRRLEEDEWDEPFGDTLSIKEFVHEHHELMERLADYDK